MLACMNNCTCANKHTAFYYPLWINKHNRIVEKLYIVGEIQLHIWIQHPKNYKNQLDLCKKFSNFSLAYAIIDPINICIQVNKNISGINFARPGVIPNTNISKQRCST